MNNLDKIAPALVQLQADMEAVEKTADNPFFKSKYTPLPQVMEALQPLLKQNKLAILLPLTNVNGVSAIKTVILHESGQVMEFDPFPLIMDKQTPQGQGSAVTYARRYALQSATGMVSDEDDDGNKASKPVAKPVIRDCAEEQKEAETEILAKAKSTINKELEKAGYDTAQAKLAFVTSVIGKATIDNLNDADSVADALEMEE